LAASCGLAWALGLGLSVWQAVSAGVQATSTRASVFPRHVVIFIQSEVGARCARESKLNLNIRRGD
jgi:hypothetical protein